MTPHFLETSIQAHSAQQRAFYLYDYESINHQCRLVSSFHSDNFQARYAMKANPHPHILHLMQQHNIRIDACSEYEVYHALDAGFASSQIQLSAQQSPESREKLNKLGITCIATSLSQVEDFCKACPGSSLGVRINPGQGSGQFKQINTGGIESSFGIWYEYIDRILQITQQYATKITTLHIHIGSGSDTQKRIDTLQYCLSICHLFPDLSTLNMGGGFKIARMKDEKETDMQAVLTLATEAIARYNQQHNKNLRLEIEPGSFYVAQYGYIVCHADDIVDTGPDGYHFVKTTTGMDMILRPALYNAQHPIYHYSKHLQQWSKEGNYHYVIVGHCCESTDLLTPDHQGNVSTKGFSQPIERGDIIVIGGCGAYCESMRCVGYNGF